MISTSHQFPTPPALPHLAGRRIPVVLYAILLLALAARVWGTWFGAPSILHPDEHFIANKALNMLRAPEYDLNPRFFEYPSLYTYLTALLYFCAGLFLIGIGKIASLADFHAYALQNLFYFHLLGRLLTAVLGAATVWLAYRLARQLYGDIVALAAAWFLTFSYVHFTDSHFLTVDVPSAFFVTLTLLVAVVGWQSRSLRMLFGAGFCAGLAASTKYPVGLVLVPVLLAEFFRHQDTGRQGGWPSLLRRLFALGMCSAAGFVLGTPYVVLDFRSFASGLIAQILHSKSGHLGVQETGFLGYFTSLVPRGGVGFLLLLAVGAGLAVALRRSERRDLLLLSFPLVFYILLGRSALKVDRYLIPALPFFAIYAGILVERLGSLPRIAERRRPLFVALLIAFFSSQAVYAVGRWCWIAVQPDTRLQAKIWMEANLPPDAVIACRVGSWMLPPLDGNRYQFVKMPLVTEESPKRRLSLKLELLHQPVTAWLMEKAFGYRRDEIDLASLRRQLHEMPGFSDWRAGSLDTLRAQQARYVLTSDLMLSRFYEATTIRKYPAMAKSWQDFFSQLEREGRLVKEFIPPIRLDHPWGMGFLERPVIRLYDISLDSIGARVAQP